MHMAMRTSTLVLTLLTLSPFSYADTIGSSDTFSLTITVNHLQNSKGVVQFSLYNKDGTIPDEEYTNTYLKQNEDIHQSSSQTVFRNLPKGRYAVNILHDENKNGAIDKGFILPIEGVGFTNYNSIGLTNLPNFTQASFEVETDTEKSIKIIYF